MLKPLSDLVLNLPFNIYSREDRDLLRKTQMLGLLKPRQLMSKLREHRLRHSKGLIEPCFTTIQ